MYFLFRAVKEEENSSGVAISSSCCFSVGHHDNWSVIGSAQDSAEVGEDTAKSGILGRDYKTLIFK